MREGRGGRGRRVREGRGGEERGGGEGRGGEGKGGREEGSEGITLYILRDTYVLLYGNHTKTHGNLCTPTHTQSRRFGG